MLVFKYLPEVFKYLTITYNNHPVKKCALSLITVHILGLHDFAELSEDQRHMSKIFWQLTIGVKAYQHTVSTYWPVSNVE